MANLRFFEPSMRMERYTQIKVYTTSNTVKTVTLNNDFMVRQNDKQVCFEKEYLEKEIIKQVVNAISAFGIRNLDL